MLVYQRVIPLFAKTNVVNPTQNEALEFIEAMGTVTISDLSQMVSHWVFFGLWVCHFTSSSYIVTLEENVRT